MDDISGVKVRVWTGIGVRRVVADNGKAMNIGAAYECLPRDVSRELEKNGKILAHGIIVKIFPKAISYGEDGLGILHYSTTAEFGCHSLASVYSGLMMATMKNRKLFSHLQLVFLKWGIDAPPRPYFSILPLKEH